MHLPRRLLVLGCVASASAMAQQEPPLLRGITTVVVVVNVTGPAAALPSEERLRTIIELRLRTAGLIVQRDDRLPGEYSKRPMVHVFVMADSIASGDRLLGYTALVTVEADEPARAPHNGARSRVGLWGPSIGLKRAPPEAMASLIETSVTNAVDQLANAWLEAKQGGSR